MQKVDKKLFLFITVLLILSAWFRFYNLPSLLYWMFDEERDAFIVKKIIVDKHPTLIGGSIPGGFYLAPGYFYISTIFYSLSNLNPIGPGIAASTLGVISVVLLFYVSNNLFNKKTAVLSSLIYAASYLVVIYSRTWWPLTFAPLVSLFTYLSLFKIIKSKDYRWTIPLSFALIIGAQSDPSNFSLIILTIAFWIIFKLRLKDKFVISAIFLFILSHLPLLVFDLRHGFLNSKQLLRFFSFGSTDTGIDPIQSIKSLQILPQIFSRFFYVSSPDTSFQIIPHDFYITKKIEEISFFLIITSIAVLGWFLAKVIKTDENAKLSTRIIGGHFLIGIAGMVFYNSFFPGYTYEWFFQVLFPAFAIISGLFLSQLLKFKLLSPAVWIIVSVYLVLSVNTLLNAKNSYNFSDKSKAVKWAIEQTNGRPFSLDSLGHNFAWGGYRYLFYLYNHEPSKSYIDHVYRDWLYPKSTISEGHPETVVVMVNRDLFPDDELNRRYNSYAHKISSKEKFGAIEVLIIDNSEKWVDW